MDSEELAGLLEEGEELARTAQSAATAPAGPGSDETGSVRVTVDAQGQVAEVSVAAGWKRERGPEGLPAAVIEAVRDALSRRLAAWGEAYGEGKPEMPGPMEKGQGDFQRKLGELATRRMSAEDRRAALSELLSLLEAVERGLDEVDGQLESTLGATHTGHSPDRHVAVTVTGGGEVVDVRFGREWLRGAHEINIGRQTTAAFRSAYEKAAAHGVQQLIAGSPLGAAQRETQDPFGLARRLKLTSDEGTRW
ncbi:YbaB/EbfC family nucleoid-associated protein [Paractinoplanes atraurantiacus]|uniref:YbaB/EbfC DNA-binding family protein n=1 Tax=Paractinoplanes atraurantiacus TaxID=1036182 RepID=A0A285GYJ0_9ACTN|nr:YbaB/EbfC family nucleoid-associated protein [Actinoplanes atraurantiacus]SNY28374.1 hypothetical protein SAMN05421748_10371 [Actinoplanes atraurantiacus]